jgi:cytochrome c553
MKRFFKWTAIGLAAAAGVTLLAAVGMMLATDMRLAKSYTVEVAQPPVSSDPAAIEQGRHLAEVYCTRCHGEKLDGGPFFADASLGLVDAPNLTRGNGGVGAAYEEGDWVRAIRHGIGPGGKPLFIMPSGDFQHFGDGDLAALIAYLKRVPPVDNQARAREFTPLARILYTAGAFGSLIPAEWIDHAALAQPTQRPPAPEAGPTAEYGAYIAALGGCRTCHGADLGGGKDSDPQAPPAPNLTRGGELRGWQEADFFKALRAGKTPTGRPISDFMPWRALGRLSDEELRGLWLYLQGAPAAGT